MKQHKIICRLGAVFTSAALAAGVLVTGVGAEESVTAAQVRQTANAAASYLTETFVSTGYSGSDLATVQLLYRSGLSEAEEIVDDYLALAAREWETYGAAVYQGYDQNYDPVASPSLVGTLGAAWLARETGDEALSARMVQAGETLGTAEFIAADNPYNIARALWCAEELGCSQTLRDNLAQGLLSYYSEEEQAFDYWGCSVDTNTVMARGAMAYTGEVAGVAQAAEHAMTFVDSLRQPDGSYFSDFQYSTDSNADSTGLALSALADQAARGDETAAQKAAVTYQALMDRYFVADSGAFGYMDNTSANSYATADALEGLLTYAEVLEQHPPETPVTPQQPEETTSATETESAPSQETSSEGASETSAGESSPQTGDDSAPWAAGALAALLLAVAAGVVGMKKVRK